MTFGHCIRYDSVTNKIFATSSELDWVCRIARINPATFAVEQTGTYERIILFQMISRSWEIMFTARWSRAGTF